MIPKLTDSRRLTGANLHWERPSAIIDMSCEGPVDGFIQDWSDSAERLLSAVNRAGEKTTWRTYKGGASVLISAPIDALYSMCELNEVAFAMAQSMQRNIEDLDFDVQAQRLRTLFDEESNPPLLALQEAALDHNIPFLWDDDEVSVGYGASAQVWTPEQVPAIDTIDWSAVKSIPVAMVTGTNGKSTTVRMAAAIMNAAGITAGLTSTDWVRIGEHIIDHGDYSGTGGARMLMRHPDTEMAVLETARGGMLRRGLGLQSASAAVITNVAADHLGDYGINTVPELIDAKFIVRQVLAPDAPLILNADDEGIVAYASQLDNTLVWFSLDPANPVLTAHCSAGGLTVTVIEDELCLVTNQHSQPVVAINDIPASVGGAARHNVQNALAAVALCHTLGVPAQALSRGLKKFKGDESDNPGRSNWFEKDGIRILVDFAHNEHGMEALADMLARIPCERRSVLLSQAGDRSDKDIRDMAMAACRPSPDRVLLTDLPGYERGREQGEVIEVLKSAVIDSGVDSTNIEVFSEPQQAVASALQAARPGDLLVLFVLTQRQDVLDMLHRFIDN